MTAVIHGPLVYLGIVAAAMVEGEVTYVAASTLVAAGHLNALAVVLAGIGWANAVVSGLLRRGRRTQPIRQRERRIGEQVKLTVRRRTRRLGTSDRRESPAHYPERQGGLRLPEFEEQCFRSH